MMPLNPITDNGMIDVLRSRSYDADEHTPYLSMLSRRFVQCRSESGRLHIRPVSSISSPRRSLRACSGEDAAFAAVDGGAVHVAVADHSCCWGSDAAEVDSCSVAGGFESNEIVGIRMPALASLVIY